MDNLKSICNTVLRSQIAAKLQQVNNLPSLPTRLPKQIQHPGNNLQPDRQNGHRPTLQQIYLLVHQPIKVRVLTTSGTPGPANTSQPVTGLNLGNPVNSPNITPASRPTMARLPTWIIRHTRVKRLIIMATPKSNSPTQHPPSPLRFPQETVTMNPGRVPNGNQSPPNANRRGVLQIVAAFQSKHPDQQVIPANTNK